MTALLPMRRRADAFADALDAFLDGPGGADPSYAGAGADPRFERLLAVVSRLDSAAAHDVRPGATFTSELRERLMSAAETELVATDDKLLLPASDRSRAKRRQNRITAGVAALAVVAGTTGVAVAASRSVPGESLYPFKRDVEQVQSALALGRAAHGREQLDQADARLGEVARMVRGAGDAGQLNATIDAFTDQAGQGADTLFAAYQATGDDATVRSVRDFTDAAMARMDDLAAQVPASALPALTQASQTLSALDDEARLLCPGCTSGGAVSSPAALSVKTVTLEMMLTPYKVTSLGSAASTTGTGRLDDADATDSGDEPRSNSTFGVDLPDVKELTGGAGGNQPGLGSTVPDVAHPLVGVLTGSGSETSGRGTAGGDQLGRTIEGTVGGTSKGVGRVTKGLTGGIGDTLNGLTGGLTNSSDKNLLGKKRSPEDSAAQ